MKSERIYTIHDLEFYGIPSSRRLLLIGHPRFGSGYIASVLQAAGIDIGHERVYEAGSASWMFAVDDLHYPYGDSKAYHKYRFDNIHIFIRNPLHALPSCIVENTVVNSYNFRRFHILNYFGVDLDSFSNRVDRAAASIVFWYKICELKRPVSFVKIDSYLHVSRFLTEIGVGGEERIAKALRVPVKNSAEQKWGMDSSEKIKPTLNKDLIDEMSPVVRGRLYDLCCMYGYEPRIDDVSTVAR